MKYAVRGFGAVLALAIVYLTTACFVPAVRFGLVCAPVYALAIHFELVDVKSADWGYLKLRSGDYGSWALRWIERNSAPEIARVSAAVQNQWFEAGHDLGDRFPTQKEETRFTDLYLPGDAKTVPQALEPGQSVPASFWRDQRFRACEDMVSARKCLLRMQDMTGDGKLEIIVEKRYEGTDGELFVNPVRLVSWTIYGEKLGEWHELTGYYPCDVDKASTDGKMIASNQKLDMLWVNGHAVNFFRADCYSAGTTMYPAQEHIAGAKNIKVVEAYPLLPTSKPLPSSLKLALMTRQIILQPEGWPPTRLATEDKDYVPSVKSLPPCFTAAGNCAFLVTDLNHDSRDDVIVFDAKVHKVRSAPYRIVSLLIETPAGWKVIDNHAVCVTPFENMKIERKPARWRAVEFAERTILPDEETDTCVGAYLDLID
jgi:hypothetical protein